jgi:hypothetical protein
MTPEQREMRAVELEREVSREWVRFALIEAVLLWLPFMVFLVLYVTDAIAYSSLVPVVIVGVLSGGLVTYWLFRRIMPLQRELRALRAAV